MRQDWPSTPEDATLGVVSWYDIVENDNWNDDEQPDYVTAKTVGWLLEDTPQYIRIASSFVYEDNKWAGIHTFPKAVPEFLPLEPAKPKKRGRSVE